MTEDQRGAASGSLEAEVKDALDQLERYASEQTRDGMLRYGMLRYGIVAPRALGVSVGDVRALGKRIGKNHPLARALWKTGVYEARLLAAFVADPVELSPGQKRSADKSASERPRAKAKSPAASAKKKAKKAKKTGNSSARRAARGG